MTDDEGKKGSLMAIVMIPILTLTKAGKNQSRSNIATYFNQDHDITKYLVLPTIFKK